MSSKRSKGGYYGVRKGRTTGVFSTWAECEAQIKGFTDARYQKFPTRLGAEQFVAGDGPSGSLSSTGATTDAASSLKGKKRALSADVEDESEWEVVYSDGACKGNGREGSVAGVGVWWGENDPRNIAERCPGEQTNNRAELIAILRVLEETPFSDRPLLIKSDSQYSINCFKTWIKGWAHNGFRTAAGAPVKNAAIIRCISKLLDIRARHGQRVRLQYVKGHSGHIGNDGADEMANRGAILPFVDERNWAELEGWLTTELEGTTLKVKPASLEVQGPDDAIDTVLSEGRSKARKLSSGVSQAYDPSKNGASYTLTKPPSKGSGNIPAYQRALGTLNHSESISLPYSASETHGNTTMVNQTLETTSKQSQRTMMSPQASAARLSVIQQALSPSKPPWEDSRKLPREKVMLDALSVHIKTPPNYSISEHPQPTKSADVQHGEQRRTPAKMRRPPKSPLKVIYAAPPLIPAGEEEIDPNDYANYFADPNELAKELLE